MIVSIEGLIGVGKSTLMARLAAAAQTTTSTPGGTPVQKFELRSEELDTWCAWHGDNLLRKAYEGGSMDVFRLQLCVQLTRTRSMQEARAHRIGGNRADGVITLMERCAASGLHCFGWSNMEMGRLSKGDYEMLHGLLGLLPTENVTPDIVIYLHCPMNELMTRIQLRGRSEEAKMQCEYLCKLEEAHERWLSSLEASGSVRVVRVSADASKTQNELAEEVGALIDELHKCWQTDMPPHHVNSPRSSSEEDGANVESLFSHAIAGC